MSEKSVFPKIELFPRLRKAGEFISHFVLGPHLFSEVSDHKFGHDPLLSPDVPVRDWARGSAPDISGKDL